MLCTLDALCVEQIAQKVLYLGNQKLIKMETKQLVDSILETVRVEISQFVEEESQIKCPIEYETRVLEIARTMSRSLIMGSQGKLPKSRNTKKKF